jgi:hypothetical protein
MKASRAIIMRFGADRDRRIRIVLLFLCRHYAVVGVAWQREMHLVHKAAGSVQPTA